MNLLKIIIPFFVSSFVNAELVEISEQDLATFTGQSGVTLEGNVKLTIDDISYQQTPDSSYQVLHDIVADYQYGATTIDVTSNGSIRFRLPEFIQFNELSMGLYTSNTAQVDTSASNKETYTIYASTLGDSYENFTLGISGAKLENGSNSLNGSYVNTNTLENNTSTTFTISEAADVTINLESEDDSWFAEDYAQITLVDEDGNILKQEGSEGNNDATLVYSFDSAIENNFILHATLTGTFKMGGAIEMFSFNNASYKR